jgi:threonine dehydrogenase-like Zn-dependent dehydrogenase
VVVDARGVVPLPPGTDPHHAALTEPLAVGLHAVNRSRAAEAGSAIVIGCGPVGLAVISALRVRGVPLVVAADFSPVRRHLAAQVGAHVVTDPRHHGVVDAWRDAGGRGRAVLFEAVGVPGLLDEAMRAAPSRSQVVVVGLCMEPDRIEPAIGVMKQLTVTFVLGWTAAEFRESLGAIATGVVDASALITGRVALDRAAAAFDELERPEHHVKILVLPNGGP